MTRNPLVKIVILLALAGGAYMFLRTKVHFLASYEGQVEGLDQRTGIAIEDGQRKDTQNYYLQIVTDDGQRWRVLVDSLTHGKARTGQSVTKEVFTNDLVLLE